MSNLMNTQPNIGRELLDVPMGDMIRDMAFAIAEAQMKLDSNSIDVAEMMGGLKTITDTADPNKVVFEDSRVFFGKEKLTVAQAVEIFNSTDDASRKAAIRAATENTTTPANATATYSGSPVSAAIANNKGANEISVPTRISMLELGFTPTFYQFVDTIIEVKISIRYSQEGSASVETKSSSKQAGFGINRVGFARGVRVGRAVTTSQVNASYSQKYSYSAEGSSLLRTKLVPVPPPPILEERIRQQMEISRTTQPTP
jgi:hypothetical protein